MCVKMYNQLSVKLEKIHKQVGAVPLSKGAGDGNGNILIVSWPQEPC